jgi:hypothetical protein
VARGILEWGIKERPQRYPSYGQYRDDAELEEGKEEGI